MSTAGAARAGDRERALAVLRRLLAHAPPADEERQRHTALEAWLAGRPPSDPALAAALASWAVQSRAIDELCRAVRDHDLTIAFLKGTDLNLRGYPEPGLRRMVDLDVLVAEEELAPFRALVETLGYERSPLPGDPPVDTAFEWRYVRRPDDVLLDVHTAVDWPEGLGVSTRKLLERRVHLAPGDVPVLDGADLVLNLATHAVRDVRELGVTTTLDASFALSALDVDLAGLVERARVWRARPALRVLLGRVARFAGGDVSHDVLRRLEVGVLPRLVSRHLASFVRPPRVLRPDAVERLVRLAMVERWRDRWRLARRYARLRWRGRR